MGLGLGFGLGFGLELGLRIVVYKLLENVAKCGSIRCLKLTNGMPPRSVVSQPKLQHRSLTSDNDGQTQTTTGI